MAAGTDLELSDLQFTKLCGIIHANTGITIADGRKSMLVSRLRSRLREIGDTDFKAYLALVSSDKDEMQELINRVTTNKTLFYRTPRVWEHFREIVVEEFLAKRAMRPMRIWSAASSTGEEAYTAGMVLETVRAELDGFDYKIIGSDISSRVLNTAETGVYPSSSIATFRRDQPDLFRHMVGNDADGFQVAKQIKSRINFKMHNLQKRMANTSPFDVVFLRNVLIYFTPEDQEAFLANIHAVMPPHGTLYIGESESLTRLHTDFEILEPMVYRPRSGMRKLDA
ncbi:MAG: CheR family methyltransferase [Pseudomonadota bacterium]